MIRYKEDFATTVILIILTLTAYILKYINAGVEEIKIIAYITIFAMNIIILCNTLASKKSLDKLIQHKISGENAKNKFKIILTTTKTITNTKDKNVILKFIFAGIVCEFLVFFI